MLSGIAAASVVFRLNRQDVQHLLISGVLMIYRKLDFGSYNVRIPLDGHRQTVAGRVWS